MTASRIKTGIVLTFVVLIASGCSLDISLGDDVTGSGVIVQTEVPVADADQLDVSSTFDVEVTVGEAMAVVLETDDNVVDLVEVKVSGDTLSIGLDGNGVTNATLRAFVTMPSLSRLEIAGASSVDVVALDGGELEIDLAGASTLAISGTIESAELDVSGASTAELDTLAITDSEVDISGASTVDLQSAASARGKLSGASTLRVGTAATVDVEVNGASTIDRG